MHKSRFLLFLASFSASAMLFFSSQALGLNWIRYPATACGWSSTNSAGAPGHIGFVTSGSAELWSWGSIPNTFPCAISDDSNVDHSLVSAVYVYAEGNGAGQIGAQACVNYPYGIGSTNISCGNFSYTPNNQNNEYTISIADLSSWTATGQDYWFPYLNISIPPPNGGANAGIIGYAETY